MRNSYKEVEALLYWRTTSQARKARASDPTADTTAAHDELNGIVLNTEWPALRALAAAASLVFSPPPLEVDLGVFDLWPCELSDLETA